MKVGSPAAYSLMGEGFTSIEETKNPKTHTRTYVHERTERSDVTGYSVSIEYSADVFSENPVILKIVDVTDRELVGEEAQVDVCSVNLWQPAQTPGSFVAYERRFAIIADVKGKGSDALVYTGALEAVGDIKRGSFDPATLTFTED